MEIENDQPIAPDEISEYANSLSQHVCRTCMSSYDLRPLFPKTDDYRHFVRALFLSTGLKITINDGLPQKICKNCAKTIETAMRFRSKSQATQKKLLKCSQSKNKSKHKINAEIGNDKDTVVSKLEKVSKPKTIKDAEKIKRDNIVIDIGTKLDENTENSKELNSPENSFSSLSDEDEVSFSQNTASSTRPYLDLIEGPVENKGPIKCKICKKTSKTMNAFIQHSKSHFGYGILCEFCARRCLSIHQLLRHQRAKHGLARDNSFVCSYCNFQALDKEQLVSHERRIHTKERPYVCDECGEAFYTKRVLIQHGYRHKTEKPFQCNLCPSKFKLRSVLTNHQSTVHRKRYMYGCYICLKTFNKPYAVRRHISKMHSIPNNQQEKIPRYNRDQRISEEGADNSKL